MSNGFVGCHIVHITEEKLQEFLPTEFQQWQNALNTLPDNEENDLHISNIILEDFQLFANNENDNNIIKNVRDAFDQLIQAFYDKTKINGKGLTLELIYHQNGDCYDEIEEGLNWAVGDFYEVSPAGKAFQQQLELTDAAFVTWG